jgi:hypothetical protein
MQRQMNNFKNFQFDFSAHLKSSSFPVGCSTSVSMQNKTKQNQHKLWPKINSLLSPPVYKIETSDFTPCALSGVFLFSKSMVCAA